MVTPILSPSTSSRRNFNVNGLNNKPTWLLSSLSDLEERMKMLSINPTNDDQQQDDQGDTFAERAESYYQKRPHLLALLNDLYNSYVTLSDRYMQSNSKTTPVAHKRQLSLTSSITNDDAASDVESEADSSLSYQQQEEQASLDEVSQYTTSDYDNLVAELVAKSVEVEAAAQEASEWERRFGESARKAELQRSLLEVLESERVVLLNENARLEYRVLSLAEENEGLAAEAIFMRRRAGELARCAAARMREEHRVCMLTRKIMDLQNQIYGLEKRNKEYNENLTSSCCSSTSTTTSASSIGGDSVKSKKNRNEVILEGCFKMTRKIKLNHKIRKVMIRKSKGDGGDNGESKKSLWGKVKSMDLFVCGVKSMFN